MLVLSRKKNESIVIDDQITIMIIEIRGDKVRLGIDAPKNVTVHRKEIFEAISRHNATLDGPERIATGIPAEETSERNSAKVIHG